MRVAFISYEFPPDTALGGISTYVSQIARGLISFCVDVEVFCGSPTRSDTFTEGGVRVHRIKSDRTAFPTAVLPVFKQRHDCCPFNVIEGPDFMAEANAVVSAAPEIPYVVKLHTPYYLAKRLNKGRMTLARIHEQLRLLWYVLKTRDLRALLPQDREIFIREGRNLRRADEVMAPSRAILSAIRNTWIINPYRVSLVPLVFEPSPELLEIPIETNTRRVTFVGRLERRKGVHDLALAIPMVLSVLPGTRFRFVGGITDREIEEKILHRVPQNLRSQIEFTGAVPPAAVTSYLADTDICVFPSRWESFGFVVLEAMSAGRAVICTGNSGMADLVDHGEYGLLVPPEKPRAIAKAIVRLLNDDGLRQSLGRKARFQGLQRYSAAAIAPLQIRSYERAIARKAGRVLEGNKKVRRELGREKTA